MWFSSKIMGTKGGTNKRPHTPLSDSIGAIKEKKANQVPHTTMWAFKVISLLLFSTWIWKWFQIIHSDIQEDFYVTKISENFQ